MNTVIWFLVLIAFVILAVYTNICLEKREAQEFLEAFSVPVTNTDSIEDNIIKIYNDILDRYPNSKELVVDSRKILSNKMTYSGLRQRLIDSDEYSRIIKMQSNSTTPELTKMISDKGIFNRITTLYFYELKRECPKYMIYPLKDILIRLEYNENALRSLFRNGNYNYFEQDVKFIKGLDHKQLMDLFDSYFNMFDLINLANQLPPIDTDIGITYGSNGVNEMRTRGDNAVTSFNITGITANTNILRTINDKDANSTVYLKNIATTADNIFNKNTAAATLPPVSNSIAANIVVPITNVPQSLAVNNAINNIINKPQVPLSSIPTPVANQIITRNIGNTSTVLPPNYINTSAVKYVVRNTPKFKKPVRGSSVPVEAFTVLSTSDASQLSSLEKYAKLQVQQIISVNQTGSTADTTIGTPNDVYLNSLYSQEKRDCYSDCTANTFGSTGIQPLNVTQYKCATTPNCKGFVKYTDDSGWLLTDTTKTNPTPQTGASCYTKNVDTNNILLPPSPEITMQNLVSVY